MSAQAAQDSLAVGISPFMLSLVRISKARGESEGTTKWESHLWDVGDSSDKFVCQRPQLREICHCVEAANPGILLNRMVLGSSTLPGECGLGR